jgi:hypothetical protein
VVEVILQTPTLYYGASTVCDPYLLLGIPRMRGFERFLLFTVGLASMYA